MQKLVAIIGLGIAALMAGCADTTYNPPSPRYHHRHYDHRHYYYHRHYRHHYYRSYGKHR